MTNQPSPNDGPVIHPGEWLTSLWGIFVLALIVGGASASMYAFGHNSDSYVERVVAVIVGVVGGITAAGIFLVGIMIMTIESYNCARTSVNNPESPPEHLTPLLPEPNTLS